MVNINTYINWLKKYKVDNKISYSLIGDYIGYSDVGISKALKNGTLSINQVLLIAEKLNAEKNLKEYLEAHKLEIPLNVLSKFEDISEDEMSLYFIKNKDKFLQNEVVKLWIDELAIEKAKELLREEIKSKMK